MGSEQGVATMDSAHTIFGLAKSVLRRVSSCAVGAFARSADKVRPCDFGIVCFVSTILVFSTQAIRSAELVGVPLDLVIVIQGLTHDDMVDNVRALYNNASDVFELGQPETRMGRVSWSNICGMARTKRSTSAS